MDLCSINDVSSMTCTKTLSNLTTWFKNDSYFSRRCLSGRKAHRGGCDVIFAIDGRCKSFTHMPVTNQVEDMYGIV